MVFIVVEKMILKGEKVVLKPMTVEEIPVFYKWATQSDSTSFWYGELYGDRIPTYEEFTWDWGRHFFDGSKSEKGRSFTILVGDKAIGQINYNEINRKNNSVELDIIIAEDLEKSKGYGSDALKTLTKYLFQNMKIQICEIDAVTKNARAISAYEKAGFKITKTFEKKGVEWNHMELKEQ
jgi:RimJ/RimL family protein N-acetyltransferase